MQIEDEDGDGEEVFAKASRRRRRRRRMDLLCLDATRTNERMNGAQERERQLKNRTLGLVLFRLPRLEKKKKNRRDKRESRLADRGTICF